MNCYFYSSETAYLKINDEVVGTISKNITFIDAPNNAFFEFIPLNNNLYPIFCFNLINSDVNVFNTEFGNLYIPHFHKKRNLPYHIVFQQNFTDNNISCLLTVLTDGCIKFYLDGDVAATDELPFIPTYSNVLFNDNYVAVAFKNNKTVLFVYDVQTKTLCYKNVLDDFTFENTLITTETKSEFYPIKTTTEWNLGVPFNLINVTPNIDGNVPVTLLPYVFCELLKANAPLSNIVTESLLNKETELKTFIEGIGSVIPPLSGNKSELLCLYNGKLKKLKFSIINGKIENVSIDD